MNRSIFVIIARLIYDVTAVISIGRITRIILRHERLPGWILELVTVGKLAVMLAALFIVPASSPFLLALGLWFLIDEVNAWLRDVIISPLAEGDDHFTSNPPRWLLLNLVDTMIVPVAFAALFLYCGHPRDRRGHDRDLPEHAYLHHAGLRRHPPGGQRRPPHRDGGADVFPDLRPDSRAAGGLRAQDPAREEGGRKI